ncbi:hypothetical protein [Paraglaciecola sp. 20A4]|uniref:hypothetical protein n=1 Tax=Paraglaciecola sp. 20A4 TaxID=2687288 RepID=UPI001409F5D9|nr:hypothetical protein [Paraglaciecola sp. 20A4]
MSKGLRTLMFSVAAMFACQVQADFYVVVQSDNPQAFITKKEAVNLFMGRSRAFSNGDFALIFDLPRDDPKRAAFYLSLTGWAPAKVNSYWSRLMFSGQSMPPQPLPDELAMINIVERNPSALGWLSQPPTNPSLRTILVIKE